MIDMLHSDSGCINCWELMFRGIFMNTEIKIKDLTVKELQSLILNTIKKTMNTYKSTGNKRIKLQGITNNSKVTDKDIQEVKKK